MDTVFLFLKNINNTFRCSILGNWKLVYSFINVYVKKNYFPQSQEIWNMQKGEILAYLCEIFFYGEAHDGRRPVPEGRR